MNSLYKAGSDFKTKLPAVSDYSLRPLPHPSAECIARIEEIEGFMKGMLEEYLKKGFAEPTM